MVSKSKWRVLRRQIARGLAGVVLPLLGLATVPSFANGVGENAAWQFQTSQDRVNKGAVLDLVERKKGGYYDSFKTTNYNTSNTYIDKQFNCALNASSSGNGGTNSMGASTSSPSVTNSGTTSASTDANTASNGLWQAAFPAVLTAGNPPGQGAGGSLGNNQNNTGSLSSGVSGSSTNAATGAISAGGGYSTQALNSSQNNTGAQTATVSGSTACNGPLVAQ
jgi:hypothetical protein